MKRLYYLAATANLFGMFLNFEMYRATSSHFSVFLAGMCFLGTVACFHHIRSLS
jgi:hypothetical protein